MGGSRPKKKKPHASIPPYLEGLDLFRSNQDRVDKIHALTAEIGRCVSFFLQDPRNFYVVTQKHQLEKALYWRALLLQALKQSAPTIAQDLCRNIQENRS